MKNLYVRIEEKCREDAIELTLTALNTLAELTGDKHFEPIPELVAHVEAGELGRRTGKGWYDYTEQK